MQEGRSLIVAAQPTVLNVAYPFAEASLDSCGGAEQVLALIDQGLARRGYRSIVLARQGSRLCGTVISPALTQELLTEEQITCGHLAYRNALANILESYRIDLIHYHGVDFYSYAAHTNVPQLATLHLPIDHYPSDVFTGRQFDLALNCVSTNQAAASKATCSTQVIENGIDLSQFSWQGRRGDQALMLTRICPEKGLDSALKAAHEADIRLVIAGELFPYPSHLAYFDQVIKPLLDAKREYIGPVGLTEKRQLLASAKCLIVASMLVETSSLVSMEAAASGTPVIARCVGALPDIVRDGATGFVVSDHAEMVSALRQVERISSEVCRQHAEAHFGADCMVSEYCALYRRLIDAATVH